MANSLKILSIDTSCDETSAAVTDGTRVLSNVLWSQASLHSAWGGVYPSLAKRAHQERIDWVIARAIKKAATNIANVSAVAVTVGPGLAIALEVGIKKAVEIAQQDNKPLIAINHLEGHLLSPLAQPKNPQNPNSTIDRYFPAISLLASGKHTDIILAKKIGDYKVIANSVDDALGEALDKAARMLGLGYPGGPLLEKFAKSGNANYYPLPVPMKGRESRLEFSYSGLKTAMFKLVESQKPLTKTKIQNLAASFQDKAFQHVENIVGQVLNIHPTNNFFLGGGVSANIELRKRLRKICKTRQIAFSLPYSKKLCTDNAAMIGLAAYFKYKRGYTSPKKLSVIDRIPRARIDESFPWEK